MQRLHAISYVNMKYEFLTFCVVEPPCHLHCVFADLIPSSSRAEITCSKYTRLSGVDERINRWE